MEDLFELFKAWIKLFQFCFLQEVRTRTSSFLNWLCDSYRSCNAGETELWIIDFHAKLIELCCFKDWHVILHCFDLLCLVRIRLNYVWIMDVCCKIYKMMCLIWISVNICSWAWWTRWRLLRIFPESMFDLAWRGFDVVHVFLWYCACSGPFGTGVAFWLAISVWLCHIWLMKRRVSYIERHIQIAHLFDSWPRHVSICFIFYSIHSWAMLFMFCFNFSFTLKIHNSINIDPNNVWIFASCSSLCLVFYEHFFTNCAWL